MRSPGTALLAGAALGLTLVGCGAPSNDGADAQAVQVTEALPATETSRDFGDYVVHFRALNTDQLQPDVARQYGITRSRSRAMLNVSVVRKEEDSPGRPVQASVSAHAHNLTGQVKNLSMREIEDGEAVYYIGEVSVANQETLIFNIDVTPMNETSRFSVRFRQQFFTN